VSSRSLAGLAFLIGPGSLIAYSAFVWILRNAPLTTATTYAYVNPIVALLLGWAVVDEELSPLVLAGAGLIVVSVAVVLRRDEGPGNSVSEPSESPR
jgi:drug/metabolite transporter (DMT)-like permease